MTDSVKSTSYPSADLICSLRRVQIALDELQRFRALAESASQFEADVSVKILKDNLQVYLADLRVLLKEFELDLAES